MRRRNATPGRIQLERLSHERHTMTTKEDAQKARELKKETARKVREQKEKAEREAAAAIVAAANRRQLAEWQRIRAGGGLRGLMRKWSGTPDGDMCPVCKYLHGQKVPLDAPFVTEDGRQLMSPPACPVCRCTMGLTE